jgi:hypothetical protein
MVKLWHNLKYYKSNQENPQSEGVCTYLNFQDRKERWTTAIGSAVEMFSWPLQQPVSSQGLKERIGYIFMACPCPNGANGPSHVFT